MPQPLTGTLDNLLASPFVTPPTRDALFARAIPPPHDAQPAFFDASTFAILQSVCACLLPASPPNGPDVQDFAFVIDKRLSQNTGNGWRYDTMPPDREAYSLGLQGLNDAAKARHGLEFIECGDDAQDALLADLRENNLSGAVWQRLPAPRFFEELITELAEAFYSHPQVQASIGYVGMADAKGWKRVGLNETNDDEPQPNKPLPVLPFVVQTHESPNLFDLPMRRYPTAETVDAVIIGTGAGGAPLLARLAQAGLSVVALEAGQTWHPARDFATDEVAQTKLFWNDERLSAGGDPLAFGNNNSGTGVGGSTLHYTAYTPRPHPDDFRLYSDFGVGANWPFGYETLEPYFNELEIFLGISGPSPYPWGPPRHQAYPLAPLPLNSAAQLMEAGCKPLGIRTSPAANAALSARYFQPGVGWRGPCTNRGFCQAGCSVGAKASMDVTFLPLAVSHGAEIRDRAFVTQIERDATGRVNGVVFVQNGYEQRQPCRAVFLCAGAIETPRLLLLNGIGNGSGQVGRNFMAHTGVQVWGTFDEETLPYKGIPGALISEDTHRPQNKPEWGTADFAGGYLLQSIGVMPVTYISQFARGTKTWGDALGHHMSQYNHVAGINILGEGLPYPGNFVELAAEKDERGLPKPRIHYTNGANEQKITAHAEALMRAIWRNAGGQNIWAFPRNAHIIGTCRMGTDHATSVVNANGAVHDVPGLYICDNSVFPSSLAVNPALTIMAISLHTADQFLQGRNA